jgi:hypothetical protein
MPIVAIGLMIVSLVVGDKVGDKLAAITPGDKPEPEEVRDVEKQ